MAYKDSMACVREYSMAMNEIAFKHPGDLFSNTYRNYSLPFVSMVYNSLRTAYKMQPIVFAKKEDVTSSIYNDFGDKARDELVLVFKIMGFVMSQGKEASLKSYPELVESVLGKAKKWVFFFSHIGCDRLLYNFNTYSSILRACASTNGTFQGTLFDNIEVKG